MSAGVLFTAVSDIASLWELATVVSLTFLAWIFRKQIRHILESREVRVKRGKTEVALTQPAPLPALPTAGQMDEPPEPALDERESPSDENPVEQSVLASSASQTEDSKDGNENSKEPEADWFLLAIRGKTNEAAEAFARAQEDAEEDERTENARLYAYARANFSLSSTEALHELEADAETSNAPMALYLVGLTYKNLGLHERAIAYQRRALDAGLRSPQCAVAIEVIAQSLESVGKRDEGITELLTAIPSASNDAERRILYSAIGELYGHADKPHFRAAALAKAAESDPTNASSRFAAGYSLAQLRLTAGSLTEYRTALTLDPDHQWSANNIGVAYDWLEMPFKSVSNYERAKALGNSLAMANLAHRLINAGFRAEARAILDAATSAAPVHPNVGSALARIGEQEERESEREREALQEGDSQMRFMLQFADAYFERDSTRPATGRWLPTGKFGDLEITITNGSVVCAWSEGATAWRVLIDQDHLAALGNTERDEAVWDAGGLSRKFKEFGQCYTYLAADASELRMLIIPTNVGLPVTFRSWTPSDD